ncbi:hypothetical protein [uncultured Tenacibaculum sp.]|uniref:hypothetical protein n=1 Tax=uncultured Tenacibaculum sp. TaxID=174713 RepID=UPI00261A0DC2|nr:hypothetical protein [uncultured Tenacibaculum sp.]
MTLDQLRVDSYAAQVNENELTEVKGGSTWTCVTTGLSILADLITVGGSGSGGSDTKTIYNKTTVDENGCVTTVSVIKAG